MKHRIALLVVLGLFGARLGATEVPPPPKLEPIEEPRNAASLPQATAPATSAAQLPAAKPGSEVSERNQGEERIREFRLKGRLYMIHVYPAIGLPYTLIDETGDGVFNRSDARGNLPRNAQWKVLSW
ncbi:DUF2782 domain-containing protein [Uliginosibacterium sediminicola]|uniref:DUF2782 domain-containing protein n=1 Tax=Uliginosibacterium sediminicola TaxID=2024550 RepID=A0ABU9YUQ5_9RHOO